MHIIHDKGLAMQYFEIAFSGQLLPSAELSQAKAAIVRLFKADEAALARLFSGVRVVIKSRVDAATAAQYQAAFKQAGAVLELRELECQESGDLTQRNVAQHAEVQSGQEQVFDALQVKARDQYMAAFSHVQALDFGLAPVGVDLQPASVEVAAPQFDFSDLTLAPVGSDMGQLPPSRPQPLPDISHLALLEDD